MQSFYYLIDNAQVANVQIVIQRAIVCISVFHPVIDAFPAQQTATVFTRDSTKQVRELITR